MKKINSLPLRGLAMSAIVVLAFACNNDGSRTGAALLERAAAPDRKTDADTATRDGGLPQVPGMIEPRGLLLLKEADVEVTVDDMGLSARRIRGWLGTVDGYYTLWTHRRAGDSLCLEMTAKVPREQFEPFKDSVETLGTLVAETATATDMTDDYAAAQARQTLEQRLAMRYDAVHGKSELQAIDRSSELQTNAMDAEQTVAATNRHVAWATVRVRATAYRPLPPPEPTPFGRRFAGNLRDGWGGIQAVLLALAEIWPLLLLIGIGVYMAMARVRGAGGTPRGGEPMAAPKA